MNFLQHLTNTLFPEIPSNTKHFPAWVEVLLFVGLSVFFSSIGWIVPRNGLIGFDWYHFFEPNHVADFYPPWCSWFVSLLTWPSLIGLTLAGFSLAAIKKSRNAVSMIAAFATLPLHWTLFLGQIDGLALIGMGYLPWLAPIALMKPQITFFGLLARKSYIISGVIVLLVSIIIWGLWPLKLIAMPSVFRANGFEQDITLGWVGIPLFLITAWLSRGDTDMLMLSGAFVTPHIIPYNLIVICPAIGRLPAWVAIVAAALSWLPLSANWVGPWGWKTGWLFVAWAWFWLALNRYRRR